MKNTPKVSQKVCNGHAHRLFHRKIFPTTVVKVNFFLHRIRPQTPREIIDMCHVCTSVTPGEPQVILGSDKAFTYNYVFDMEETQETVYNTCVASLVESSLEGYCYTIHFKQ